jgi:uncharacterized MAPEG superfamily protein
MRRDIDFGLVLHIFDLHQYFSAWTKSTRMFRFFAGLVVFGLAGGRISASDASLAICFPLVRISHFVPHFLPIATRKSQIDALIPCFFVRGLLGYASTNK